MEKAIKKFQEFLIEKGFQKVMNIYQKIWENNVSVNVTVLFERASVECLILQKSVYLISIFTPKNTKFYYTNKKSLDNSTYKIKFEVELSGQGLLFIQEYIQNICNTMRQYKPRTVFPNNSKSL